MFPRSQGPRTDRPSRLISPLADTLRETSEGKNGPPPASQGVGYGLSLSRPALYSYTGLIRRPYLRHLVVSLDPPCATLNV